MNVLLLTDSDAFAGTERHIVTLAAGLRALGDCSATVGCPAETPVAQAAIAVGVPVEVVPRATRDAVGRLRALARSQAFDVVHAHNGRTCLLSAIAGRGASTARLLTQHFLAPARVDRRGLRGWASRRIGAWALRRTHHTLAISNAVRDAALARGDASSAAITTVLNGIDDPTCGAAEAITSDANPDRPLRIGCVARLSAEKRLDVLIDAMARLRSLGVEATCDLYGGGQLQSDLASRIQHTDAPVVLHGHRADVFDALRSSDVFALPSDAEPFGLAIVEAMALSKPVIAVDAGGPREIVLHGTTGLLVPPNDSGAMADAIASLARDPDRRAAMGRAGRERFLAQFTAQRMARETLAVYRAVLAERGRPA